MPDVDIPGGNVGAKHSDAAGEVSSRRLYVRRSPRTDYPLSPQLSSRFPWFRVQLLGWFVAHGRRFSWRESNRTAYEVLVAEILLQRTTAAKVALIYDSFLARYPSWEAIAAATSADLYSLLAPLGL